jgi:hypothetical protein
MPYIVPEKRSELDGPIAEVLNVLRGLESDDPSNNMEGNINYVFTRILKQVYPGGSYREINDAMGILSSCTSEYYRKVAIPLEDQKEFDNGPV